VQTKKRKKHKKAKTQQLTDEVTPRHPRPAPPPNCCSPCFLLPVVACFSSLCGLFAFLNASNSLFSFALDRFTVLCSGKGDDDDDDDNDDDKDKGK
jgi:hypothetical protein